VIPSSILKEESNGEPNQSADYSSATRLSDVNNNNDMDAVEAVEKQIRRLDRKWKRFQSPAKAAKTN